MDQNTIVILASIVGAVVAVLGAAYAAAINNRMVGVKALETMARQPELQPKILISSLIYIGMVEAIPIITAVIAIVLIFANPFVI